MKRKKTLQEIIYVIRQQPGILPVFICDLRDASKVIDYKKQIYNYKVRRGL